MDDRLDSRLRTLLPPLYQDTYETVQPISMGSAGLKYGPDGRVAWDEIWRTFCDLALAGGPPHRGTLLEPATPAEVARRPAEHASVVAELARGIHLVTGFHATASPHAGWVRVACRRESMTSWLLRAIVTENVSARQEGGWLDLPAGPVYRIEKEVKNVITALAKTCHYWTGHIPPDQRERIAELFVEMELESPLVTPLADDDAHTDETLTASAAALAGAITARTHLPAAPLGARGWLGVDCVTVGRAVWMMRALVVENVLARREGTVLCVPVNPRRDPDGRVVLDAVARVAGASSPQP
jgi:sirohydrochlorin cobaltochelatase